MEADVREESLGCREQGACEEGTQAASRSLKGKQIDSPLEPPGDMQLHGPILDF